MTQLFDDKGNRVMEPSALETRSWPEDFEHENGNYTCHCHTCGHSFVGHKRRVTCKLCASAKTDQQARAIKKLLEARDSLALIPEHLAGADAGNLSEATDHIDAALGRLGYQGEGIDTLIERACLEGEARRIIESGEQG